MSKRGNPYPHRYKYGVIKNPIAMDTWLKFIARLKDVYTRGYSVDFLEAIHAVFFWTGLRKSEVLGRKQIKYPVEHRECKGRGCARCGSGKVWKVGPAHPGLMQVDCRLEEDDGKALLIYSVGEMVLKHGKRNEPFWLHESLPKVPSIIKVYERTKSGRKMFPCDPLAFWRVCKAMDPKFTMHFYRHNRITDWSGDPKMSLAQIVNQTGLHPRTVRLYMMRSGRFSKETGDRMREKYGRPA